MAVATQRYFTLTTSLGTFWCDLDYEDTDFQTTNDDGDPDDFRLIRFDGRNDMDVPVVVGFKRGNGQKWFETEVAAGVTFSRNAGGPVKYESDIPQHYIRPLG